MLPRAWKVALRRPLTPSGLHRPAGRRMSRRLCGMPAVPRRLRTRGMCQLRADYSKRRTAKMTIEDACLYVADGARGRVCCVGYLHAKCLIPARHEHVASACVNDWSRRAPFGDVGYPVWLRLPRSVQPHWRQVRFLKEVAISPAGA